MGRDTPWVFLQAHQIKICRSYSRTALRRWGFFFFFFNFGSWTAPFKNAVHDFCFPVMKTDHIFQDRSRGGAVKADMFWIGKKVGLGTSLPASHCFVNSCLDLGLFLCKYSPGTEHKILYIKYIEHLFSYHVLLYIELYLYLVFLFA